MQSEADHIDEYICPNCTSNTNVNIANMKNLTSKDYEALKKLIKQIQVRVLERRPYSCIIVSFFFSSSNT